MGSENSTFMLSIVWNEKSSSNSGKKTPPILIFADVIYAQNLLQFTVVLLSHFECLHTASVSF